MTARFSRPAQQSIEFARKVRGHRPRLQLTQYRLNRTSSTSGVLNLASAVEVRRVSKRVHRRGYAPASRNSGRYFTTPLTCQLLILQGLLHAIEHEHFKRCFGWLQLQTKFLNSRENRRGGTVAIRWRTDFRPTGETWRGSDELGRSPVQPEVEQRVEAGFIKDGTPKPLREKVSERGHSYSASCQVVSCPSNHPPRLVEGNILRRDSRFTMILRHFEIWCARSYGQDVHRRLSRFTM